MRPTTHWVLIQSPVDSLPNAAVPVLERVAALGDLIGETRLEKGAKNPPEVGNPTFARHTPGFFIRDSHEKEMPTQAAKTVNQGQTWQPNQ